MSGVYLICNTVTGDFYIGSTVRKIKDRWSQHVSSLIRSKHHSPYMQNSWNKYGQSAFVWVVLEECSNVLEREQYYFDMYNPTFNTARIAGNTCGIVFTDERRNKISQALKGKIPWNKGVKTVSKEQFLEYHKNYMRKKRANNVRKTKQEVVNTQRKSSPKKRKLQRSDGLVAESVREMSRIMNIGHSEIVRAIKRQLKVRGYEFKYIEPDNI